jgi:hypothetical protein
MRRVSAETISSLAGQERKLERDTSFDFDLGLAIRYGLDPQARPATEPEYKRVVDRVGDEAAFSAALHGLAAGLGLRVAEVGWMGVILVPVPGSIFAMKWSEYREQSSTSADGRMLDGLIHIAIMATVFPLEQDLVDTSSRQRTPVTGEEVDNTLRSICTAMEAQPDAHRDPLAHQEAAGLYEAWRVYKQRLPDGPRRGAMKGTKFLIEDAFEFLIRNGCMQRTRYMGQDAFQATQRYRILVQDFAAEPLHSAVRAAMDSLPALRS